MQTNSSFPKSIQLSSVVIIAVSLGCIVPFALGAVKKADANFSSGQGVLGQPLVMQSQPDCTPTPTPTPPVE